MYRKAEGETRLLNADIVRGCAREAAHQPREPGYQP